jgi:hydroxymethylglutaryl-CoA lyase
MKSNHITLVECPRDAMQGIEHFIDTNLKVDYINALLRCNFDVIDVGSFVSPKAIPQMKDTAEVLDKINFTDSKSKLLTIIANLKGAEQAAQFDNVSVLGFPLSISNTFQLRNTNKSIEEALIQLEEISSVCIKNSKELVVYLSMGFGNPYGDTWKPELLSEFIYKVSKKCKVDTFALSDTIGAATPELVYSVFNSLNESVFQSEISAHLHVLPENAIDILNAAYDGGCRRFDGAIKGFGGCPMATNKLTGNMPTEKILDWTLNKNIGTNIDMKAFQEAFLFSSKIFK